MPQAIGISGSPRCGGNSETLLAAALEGAASAGATTELVRLNELTYVGCQNCEACVRAGHCTVEDGLTPVLAALREADLWLLASPIYFDSVSGQLKTFFDRCWCFIHKPNRLPGRRAGALLVTYGAGPTDFYAEVARHLAGYFNWFGSFDPVEVLAEPSLGPADAARQRPELLAGATDLGRRLAVSLSAT